MTLFCFPGHSICGDGVGHGGTPPSRWFRYVDGIWVKIKSHDVPPIYWSHIMTDPDRSATVSILFLRKQFFLFTVTTPPPPSPQSFHWVCKLPLGCDKHWTHHWLQLHVHGMMQMMTNFFFPHHACDANRCNTQWWACLSTWLRGWAAPPNQSVESYCCQATQHSPLAYRTLFTFIELQCLPLPVAVCEILERHNFHLAYDVLVNAIKLLHISMSSRWLCSYFSKS